ncbi:MAG: hypothetical protein WC862_00190 [Patescibacteria group bacterium]
MAIFKRKIYQSIYEASISVVLVVSLSISITTPQVVNAETQEDAGHDLMILNVPFEAEELNTFSGAFPLSADRKPVKTIKAVATAYTSHVWQTDDTPCITANGFDLCEFYEKKGFGNTIASNFLPMGTQVRFPEIFGDKIFVVRDRMNARYGYGRIDIWMPELPEAKVFGVKRLVMEVF